MVIKVYSTLKIKQWFEAERSKWFKRWLRGHKYQIYKSTIKIKIKDHNLTVIIKSLVSRSDIS